jgi:beta-glucosidase
VTFPDGFLWGASTSSFQIEGSLDADGRGRSIWDDFAIETAENGAVACDHYRRWRDDVELIASLGVNAYRFSLAWPRIVPDGRGAVEQRGIDHYSRLIDALLEHGIEPVVTLYHWDLPVTLDWRDRDTADRFAEYAAICFDSFGDRVRWWITINEPWVHGILGYAEGMHAPGEKDLRGAVYAMHHMLHGHALAYAQRPSGQTGIAFSLFPTYPESDSEADREAARICDGYHNRWFLDPVLKGAYPDDMVRLYEERVGPLELDPVPVGCDFVGVNYYSRGLIRHDPDGKPFPYHVLHARNEMEAELTDGGYEIAPFGLTDLLVRLKRDYGDVPVMITENGAIYYDAPHDPGRVDFLRRHVAAVGDALAQGVDVRGYCHWSLMDNFEWAMGYKPRFGLVHVDYETQERTVKDSGRAYGEIAARNGL